MEEYSTFFKTGRNVRLAVAGYQEIGIDYLKLSLVQHINKLVWIIQENRLLYQCYNTGMRHFSLLNNANLKWNNNVNKYLNVI